MDNIENNSEYKFNLSSRKLISMLVLDIKCFHKTQSDITDLIQSFGN